MTHAEFTILYSSFYKQLVYYSCKYVPLEASEEITNDAFIKLWQLPKPIDNAKDYLYKTVHNKCINYIEATNAKFRNTEIPTETVHVAYEELDFMVIKRLHASINTLPDRCRWIVIMFYFHKKHIIEIALKLNCSASAVTSQLHRARKLLKIKNL